MRRPGSSARRLQDLREEAARLRERVGILDEQVAYVASVAEEAHTRALVSSTPLADRESREAEEDLRRTRAQRDEAAARLAEIAAEQDLLLERMLDGRSGGGGGGPQ